MVGLGENPAPVYEVLGLVPAVVGMLFEKLSNTDGEALVIETCPKVTTGKSNNKNSSALVVLYIESSILIIICLNLS
jgi:hypothetical protein